MVIVLLLCINTACTKYNYKDEQPTGIMLYEVEPESAIVNNYAGEYCKVSNTPWYVGMSNSYSDENLTICSSELRYSVAILYIYYTGNGILQDFVIDFKAYDKDNNRLEDVSCTTYLAGGYLNSIIVKVPENTYKLQLVDYYGTDIQASSVQVYNFDNKIEQRSQSYYYNNTPNLVILFDENNIVVDWCTVQGVFISGRSGIKKYGLVEVQYER